MLKTIRIILAPVLALALASLLAERAGADTTSTVMVQTFSGATIDGSSISGTIQIPTLAVGSAVTGSGTIKLVYEGTTVYSGGFTATTLKSLTPTSASGFVPIIVITPATTTVVTVPGMRVPLTTSTPMTITNGPVTTAGLSGALQLTGITCTARFGGACSTASVPTTQDLFLYFAKAKTMLDVGITLTGSVSNSAALAWLAIDGVAVPFPSLTGTSTGLTG